MSALISIIIPTYNRSSLLHRCLDSLIVQSYEEWEALVVDDGSTDITPEVMRAYLSDRRIIYLRQAENRGASVCRNVGLEAARGRFVNFLDSDDELLPEKLERQVEVALSERADVVLSHTLDARTGVVLDLVEPSGSLALDFITKKIRWPIQAPLWSQSFLSRVGRFNEALSSSIDFEYFGRAVILAPRMAVVNDVLSVVHVEEIADDPYRIRYNPVIPSARNRIRSRRSVLEALLRSATPLGVKIRGVVYLIKFIFGTWAAKGLRGASSRGGMRSGN